VRFRFGYSSMFIIERSALFFVLFWGNWAIYYWLVVLVFDGSYLTLKHCSPIYLLQLALSCYYFARIGPQSPVNGVPLMSHDSPWDPHRVSWKQMIVAVFCAVMLCGGTVLVISHFHWSATGPGYNLFWVILLPVAAYYLYRFATPSIPAASSSLVPSSNAVTFDTLLFLLGTALFVSQVYDFSFFRADDAYYVNVISSTLAHPELPVQGTDAMLGTGSPYTLHPAYRGVGYEVLIALVGDLTHTDPLYLYYRMFPALNAVFWLCAWYLFCRALRTPYPGLAVMASLLILLLWTGPQAPTYTLRTLDWGKSLLALVSLPVLFSSVAVFISQRNLTSWLLLLLSVCSLAILSTSAMFIIPMSIGLSCIVLLSLRWSSLRAVLLIALAASPVILLTLRSLSVSHAAPVYATGAYLTGPLRVNGEAFGGLQLQAITLVLLLTVPLLARTVSDRRFQQYILRLCLAGYFTLMAPYLVELAAVVAGMNFLSDRIFRAFPFALLAGIMASILALNVAPGRRAVEMLSVPRRLAVLVFGATLLAVFIGAMERDISFDYRRSAMQSFWEDYVKEAIAARALIEDDAVVAAGKLDVALPILPDPPRFVHVRHYLDFHKLRLTERDYADREYLFRTLRALAPPRGEDIQATMDRVVATAQALGVTTLVFAADASTVEEQQFAERLTSRLNAEGYECATTPSAATRVCNR